MSTENKLVHNYENKLELIEKFTEDDSMPTLENRFSHIGQLIEHLTDNGKHRLYLPNTDRSHSDIKLTARSSDPLIKDLFIDQYCENPDKFLDLFTPEYCKQAILFTSTIFGINDKQYSIKIGDDKNDRHNQSDQLDQLDQSDQLDQLDQLDQIDQCCMLESNGEGHSRTREAEYLWNNCAPNIRQKIKDRVLLTSIEVDNKILKTIDYHFGKLASHLPDQLKLVLLDEILMYYNKSKLEYGQLTSHLKLLNEKQKKYDQSINLIKNDDCIGDKIINEATKFQIKMNNLIEIDKKAVTEKITSRKRVLDMYKKYFDSTYVIKCNICSYDKVECASNCGHLFCRSCADQIRANYSGDRIVGHNDRDKICPYCNAEITQFINIYL